MFREHGDRASRQLRHSVAHLAAQLLMQDGALSYAAARRKAAERIGDARGRDLPDLAEVEAALMESQRIFGGSLHAECQQDSRADALRAMKFLAEFEPRLVGRILAGTAGPATPVCLHVFAETAEEVLAYLHERGVPCELVERRFSDLGAFPMIRFVAGVRRVELVVFPHRGQRQAPRSDVTGKPMARADISAVRALVDRPGAAGAAT
ncbi:MAG: hypothetical protein NFCOHLIN_01325 [Gammaproteobacteria bacterium]|nr:hypothetical protein [Gammaproteobacteria bacterium]